MVYPRPQFKEKYISLVDSLDIIADFNRRLSSCVATTIQEGYFLIVIGGDHGNAVGTWNGVAQSCSLPFGLIWIDAHMDAHTLETTPSGAWHGMPLAHLMGYGVAQLSELHRKQPILQPAHLCLIGTRSFEEGEKELLERLNVKIYFIDEVKKRGVKAVLKEAIAYISTRVTSYGVSLDVDVIDPSEAPGTGCFEPNGLAARDLIDSLILLREDRRLKAFELVEYNPYRDLEQKTAVLCREILEAVVPSYHFASGGIEQRIASGLPPERNPN